MTPNEIRERRLELQLTIEEFAWALDIPEAELIAIESGRSQGYLAAEFRDAMERLEERLFGTYVGA